MGCGWLGLPLANSFVSDGYRVHGSTTSEEKLALLKKEGIVPFLISFHEDVIKGDISGFLHNIDLLVVNIPPKLRRGNSENYVKKIELLHREIKKNAVKKVIFISSTSVYGNVEGKVTEESIPDPITESGKQLLAAEQLLSRDKNLQTTIVRFGGLIGPNRHPVTMLSGRKELSNGSAPINLIHIDDCIRIIRAIFQNSWWNELINGVHPNHPAKQKYYTKEAKKRNLQAPDYKEDNAMKGKIIAPKVLLTVKNYKFITTP